MRKHTLPILLICLAALLNACASPTTPSPAPSASGTPSPSAGGSAAPSRSAAAASPPASTTEIPAADSELPGTEWTLTSLNGSPPVEGSTVTLSFANATELGGDGGCNSYGGTYTAANDGTITVADVLSTLQACSSPAGVTEQETAYLQALREAAAYQFTGDQLEIQNAAGDTTLIFTLQEAGDAAPSSTDTAATGTPGAELNGSAWVLQKLQGQNLIESTNITLVFDGDQATGYAGCNGYNGTYTASDGALSFRELAATERACLEPEGVLEQESTFLETLTEIAAYTNNGENLELKNAAGDPLLIFSLQERFAMNPADLLNTQWRLRSFNGQDLPADTQYTLSFTSDRDASGSTGCQTYAATYEAAGDSLRFPQTETTTIDCMRPRSQGQEIDFLSSFTFGAQYRLNADQLEVLPVEGGTLVWQRLGEDAAMVKEPTVWTLQGFVEGETTTPVQAGTAITLSFDEDTLRAQGTVSGSAGCNTYRAGYTYGETFTISAPVTTRMACEPAVMEQEQRFLDLLQNIRTYSLDEQLLLQTEDGRGLLFAVQ